MSSPGHDEKNPTIFANNLRVYWHYRISTKNLGENAYWLSAKINFRSYLYGEANTTVDGIPCQKWSDTEPHSHTFTHVGDHNFCRNPYGASQPHVWCYTSDPGHERQNCSVPFCAPLKTLDFSLDNDGDEEFAENKNFTHASLHQDNLPPSFTICTSFMVDLLPSPYGHILSLLTDKRGTWLGVYFFVHEDSFAQIRIRFDSLFLDNTIALIRLQWTTICLSSTL